MAGKGHWVSGLLGKLPVLPPFLAAAESFNAGALLLTTAPLWAPIILLALLSLGAAVPRSAARLLRSGQRSGVLTGILGPWAARRVLRALRVLLGGARAAAPQQAAAGLRRSLASSLSLAGSTTETGFAGVSRAAVSVRCFDEFRRRVSTMPARVPLTTEGSEWQRMLEKDTSVMTYRAWRHHLPSGGAEYLSVTVFEGATPLDLLDFFCDDAHRMTWDDLLAAYEVVEVDPKTGAEVVRWVRRFPLMCKQRDYVFSRRSWVDGDTYFTVSRSCEHAACPPVSGVRRVDEFYSSWRMRQVPGRNGGVACEVVLQHFEEMGIQHDLAKLAIRRGMWGCVVNMERGLCAFVKRRRERLRVRSSRRLSSGAAPLSPLSSPKRSAGTPRSSMAPDSPRPPTPLAVLLKTGLMAIGGVAVARHAAGAGPQLAGAVGSAFFGRKHSRKHRCQPQAEGTPPPAAL